jgi:hypothetical protein
MARPSLTIATSLKGKGPASPMLQIAFPRRAFEMKSASPPSLPLGSLRGFCSEQSAASPMALFASQDEGLACSRSMYEKSFIAA